jgi:hypothetical protein
VGISFRRRRLLSKLVMRNTADETGGKPIAVWSHSTSGVSVVNPLVNFYDIHGKNGEVLLLKLITL